MTNPLVDPNDDRNAYWFLAHMDDVAQSECNPDDAATLLWHAAGYLKNGEIVPKPLADFIADAFLQTMSAEQSKRPSELAAGLNLTALNRRPEVPDNTLGCWVFRQSMENLKKSETAILNEAAKHFGISKTTATDHWRNWKKKNPKVIRMLVKAKIPKSKI